MFVFLYKEKEENNSQDILLDFCHVMRIQGCMQVHE